MRQQRVVHFSDWHSEFDRKLPEADIYVCTGDMLPNFPEIIVDGKGYAKGTTSYLYGRDKIPLFVRPIGRVIHHDWEREMQTKWLAEHWPAGKFREKVLGNPTAPIVCVKGNHDFIALSHIFVGDGETHEIIDASQVFEVNGLKFGGMRGINYICGEWDDELHQIDSYPCAAQIPSDIDVLVTHAPAQMVLDYAGDFYGMQCLRNYINRAVYGGRKLVHMFGHVHEAGGRQVWLDDDKRVLASNAARTHNTIEISF